MATRAARGYRSHVSGEPRTRREVYLSADERAVIGAAADRMGLTAGAYIAAAAVRAAKADAAVVGAGDGEAPVALSVSQARELLDEVRQLRRLMGNVAGNLNDVARHANSTGELASQTGAVLDFVRRTNDRTDVELMNVLRRLR